MEVFVLLGLVSYEGSECLGVYASATEAEAAWVAYVASEGSFMGLDGHAVRAVRLGAAAEWRFD